MLRIKLVLLFLLISGHLTAQQGKLNQFVHIEADGLSFESSIEKFEAALDIRVNYDPLIVPQNKKFDLNYLNVRGRYALEDFLNRSGLTFKESGTQIIILKAAPVNKQTLYTLSGRVQLKESGEYLGNVEILNSGNGAVVMSSEAGFFSMILTGDTNIITVYYPGFMLKTDTLAADRNYFVVYELVPLVTNLSEAHILPNLRPIDAIVNKGKTDEHYVSQAKVRNFPHLLGEPDIMRVMSTFPGVLGGSEGMLGMYIRGGASDQNLVLLDDVPVFNSNHLYGIFSVFNDDAVKSAVLSKGSFPARYGGRLSSVVNVQTKEGNNFRVKGAVSVGLLSSKVFLEGPLIRDRTTFTFAFRRSYLDFLANPISKLFLFNDSLQNNIYYFWDLNARITHKFSYRSRLSLSFYSGRDVGGISEKNNTINPEYNATERRRQLSTWGNTIGSARWNYYPGKKSGITVKAHITEYNYSYNQTYSLNIQYAQQAKKYIDDYTSYRLLNGIRDLESSILYSHKANNSVSYNFGGGATLHKFIPGNRTFFSIINSTESEIRFDDPTVNTPEVFGFAEVNSIVSKKVFADLGLRISSYRAGSQFWYTLPEPRMSLRYMATDRAWFKLSAMRTRQFFHLLTNLTLGLPSDLWVPSSLRFKPSQADQISAGFSQQVKNWSFSTEGFYKKLNYLLEYKENAGYITSATNWEDAVTDGSGWAYGWEFMAEKTAGKLTGWLSYTLMHNNRRFTEINKGEVFPARYDRRHNLYFAGVYHMSKGFDISCSWTYNSGFAITTPVGSYLAPTANDPYREIFLYGARNNTRTRDNHRLDLSFNFEKKVKTRGLIPSYTRQWSVGLFNVYNRRNPFYVNMGLGAKGDRVLYQVSLLPILPNVSYRITF